MANLTELEISNARLRLEKEDLLRRIEEGEDALVIARGELRVLERMKKDFIILVSHELRTPLTSVIGMADLILNGLWESHEDLVSMVQSISKEAHRLGLFVDDTVEFLQRASGTMSLRMELLDIGCRVQEVLQRVAMRYEEKRLVIAASHGPTVEVRADTRSFESSLERVIDNAMKFSSPGGRIEVRWETSSDGEGPGPGAWVHVCVKDEGQGIPAEKIPHLCEALTIGHEYKNHVQGGGLGLAITREIVRSHGGKFRIESEGLGKGSVAILSFPLEPALARAPRSPADKSARKTLSLKGRVATPA